MVSGLAALALQRNSRLTVEQLREALQKTAHREEGAGSSQWDPDWGFGKVVIPRTLASIG
jgi:hypothetical protein